MGLSKVDPKIKQLLQEEEQRKNTSLDLIASENHCSKAVKQAQGSGLTDKYAEGYPNHRWYGSCENIDEVEGLAIERAKKLFNSEHANVQPHSGSQANMAVYQAFLEPGDKILSMALSQGGHLTHGAEFNFSGQFYDACYYGVDKNTGKIDYDEVARLAAQIKPDLIICGSSSYPREIDFQKFGEIAKDNNAYLLADIAHTAGLVAGGQHISPIPYSDAVTLTTQKTMRGPRGGVILCREDLQKEIDRAVFPGIQGGPLEHVIAAKAVCFKEALHPGFKDYCRQIINNSRELAKQMKGRDYELVSGGSDNHLLLIDLDNKGIGGKEAEQALEQAGISVNKNALPYDDNPPANPGGVRIGTPAITSRGMKKQEMKTIAEKIDRVIQNPNNRVKTKVRQEIKELCDSFPVPDNYF